MTEPEWHDNLDVLIAELEEGDLIEFEYQNMQGNITTKRGRVSDTDGYRGTVMVEFPAPDAYPWKVGSGITVEYEHERDGWQRKHLGRVERIRRVDE